MYIVGSSEKEAKKQQQKTSPMFDFPVVRTTKCLKCIILLLASRPYVDELKVCNPHLSAGAGNSQSTLQSLNPANIVNSRLP